MQITFSQTSDINWARLLLQIGYAIAIALLFVVILVSIAGQMSPAPSGDSPFSYGLPQSQKLCEEQGAVWINDAAVEGVEPGTTGYCSGPSRLEKEWNAKTDAHNRTVRTSFVVGSVGALFAGLVFLSHRTMAASLLLSAILSLDNLTKLDVPIVAVTDQTHVVLLSLAWIILLYLGRILFPRTA